MTYQFLCRFFNKRIAAVLAIIWFALILIAIFVFSAFGEDEFQYMNF